MEWYFTLLIAVAGALVIAGTVWLITRILFSALFYPLRTNNKYQRRMNTSERELNRLEVENAREINTSSELSKEIAQKLKEKSKLLKEIKDIEQDKANAQK